MPKARPRATRTIHFGLDHKLTVEFVGDLLTAEQEIRNKVLAIFDEFAHFNNIHGSGAPPATPRRRKRSAPEAVDGSQGAGPAE